MGESDAQTWQSKEFPAPNGEQAGVALLNQPLRRGRRSSGATLRNDGSAGLLWLEPGSLGESDAQILAVQGVPGAQRGAGRGRLPERAGFAGRGEPP